MLVILQTPFPPFSRPAPGVPRGPAGSLGRAKGILKGKPLRNGFPLSAPLPTFPARGKWAAGGITAFRPAPEKNKYMPPAGPDRPGAVPEHKSAAAPRRGENQSRKGNTLPGRAA